MKKRAIEYCSNNQLLADEFSLLIDIFEQNGYPRSLTYRILHEKEKPSKQTDIDFDRTFFVPFHPKGKIIYKIMEKQFGATVIFKKTRTLGDLLKKKTKGKEEKYKQNVVYAVPCSECATHYIGQTKKTIATRVAQHQIMCKKKLKLNLRKLQTDKKDNGLAYHHIITGHEFLFGKTKILAEEPNYWKRLIKEGIEIRKNNPIANLKAGYEIANCWNPFSFRKPPRIDPD